MHNPYACIGCHNEYGFSDGCILPNKLWSYIADTMDILCAACIEQRLGRALKPSDFPDRLTTVYRGQRLNVRTIPINLMFFKKRGWNIKICRGRWFKRKKNLWRNKNV